MKTKKISWQAIAIVVLALVLIASIALGVSGAWFQDADSVSESVTMGDPVTIWLQKDGSDNANVEKWSNIYKSEATSVYPGDKLMGATEIKTGTATPSVIRMTITKSVKAGSADTTGSTYDAITAMTSEEAATFKANPNKPKRNAYETKEAYDTAMETYKANVDKYNKYLIETMLDKTMAEATKTEGGKWTKSGDYYYYNDIVSAAATAIDVFASLDLSTDLTNECSGWIISVSVDVEAIQAANLSDNSDWYGSEAGKTPAALKTKIDEHNEARLKSST